MPKRNTIFFPEIVTFRYFFRILGTPTVTFRLFCGLKFDFFGVSLWHLFRFGYPRLYR
jgi:hypothetical protein